jgi:hypothetical protein
MSRLIFAVSLLFAALHVREIDWARFAIAFLLIDLVGYLPGRLARRPTPIAPFYYHLYNLTHRYRTLAVAALAWALVSGPEWSMLALPLHLSADRGLLGNFPKPLDQPFEQVRT